MKNNIRACAGIACALAFLTVGCGPPVGVAPYGGSSYGVGNYGVGYTGYTTSQPVYTNYGYGYGYQPVYSSYGSNYGYYPGYNAANAIVPGLVGFGLGAAVYGHNYNRGYYNNNNRYTYINRGIRGPYNYGGYHGVYHGGYRGGHLGNGPIVMPHRVTGGRFR